MELVRPRLSLYVGNLHPDVTETNLYEKFSETGVVTSVRICKDVVTGKSLTYGYVNYLYSSDAQLAIDLFNYSLFFERPMRVMHKISDPTSIESKGGNIFIKNLDSSIDTRTLYDFFSNIGNILSCKVATDENNVSKGYGYIHFEDEALADYAVEEINGLPLNGKKIDIQKFRRRSERTSSVEFTQVYVKNFNETVDEEHLNNVFKVYGEIQSVFIGREKDGKSKKFGFVSFKRCEDARLAVKNEKKLSINDRALYISAAQKKHDRLIYLKKEFLTLKKALKEESKDRNVFIKNIPEHFNDEKLKKLFSKYGEIKNTKVMLNENGKSKCFGFVCFKIAEDAQSSIVDLHEVEIEGKLVYVSLVMSPEDRRKFDPVNSPKQKLDIFVGDLHPSLNENNIKEIFNKKLSIKRVLLHQRYPKASNFAKIIFDQQTEENYLKQVVKELNYQRVNGWSIRITEWLEKRVLQHHFEHQNIFIENLDAQIDNKELYEAFLDFGEIISCKVCKTVDNRSKGYGFICFDKKEAALEAIKKMNGSCLGDRKVFVSKFVKLESRDAALKSNSCFNFTNLYIKDFNPDTTEEDIREIFQEYGDIRKIKIAKDEFGNSLGFGFVSFYLHQDAKNALNILQHRIVKIGDILQSITVCRMQQKSARVVKKVDLNEIRRSKYCCLYVKNFPYDLDEMVLWKAFSAYGIIRKVRVVRNKGIQRGFAFITFQTSIQAKNAIKALNGSILGEKHLIVSLAYHIEMYNAFPAECRNFPGFFTRTFPETISSSDYRCRGFSDKVHSSFNRDLNWNCFEDPIQVNKISALQSPCKQTAYSEIVVYCDYGNQYNVYTKKTCL